LSECAVAETIQPVTNKAEASLLARQTVLMVLRIDRASDCFDHVNPMRGDHDTNRNYMP
jgi:hypothetical protein